MLDFMDQTVIDVVISPKVLSVPMRTKVGEDGEKVRDDKGLEVKEPVPFEERDQEKLYVDEVDELDKQMVFDFSLGGTSDLERFLQEQAGSVESVHTGQGVEGSPEPAMSDR